MTHEIELRHEMRRHRVMLNRIQQPDARTSREDALAIAAVCLAGVAMVLAWIL